MPLLNGSVDKTGSIVVTWGVRGTVRIRMAGHVLEDAAAGMVAALDAGIWNRHEVHTFWDLEELETYASIVRTEATHWLLRNRHRIVSIHAFARSRIVRMGVAVANVALSGTVEVYGSRGPFEAALRACIDAR